MEQLNILEELREKFDEIKREINELSVDLKSCNDMRNAFISQIEAIEKNKNELEQRMQVKKDRKLELESLLSNIEENFGHVQSAALNLLDIINSKNNNA